MAEVQQGNRPQERKQEHSSKRRIRLTIIFVTLAMLIILAVIWLYTTWGNVPSTISAAFTIMGVIFALFAVPFLYSPNDAKEHLTNASPTSPAITIYNAPNVNVSTNQNMPEAPSIKASNEQKVAKIDELQQREITHPRLQEKPSDQEIELMLAQNRSFFPFSFLTDSNELFGRTLQKATLMSSIRNRESISIVGSRRIGKTWLMRYLILKAPTELSKRFRIGYLDATSANCANVSDFAISAIEALGIQIPDESLHIDLRRLEKSVNDLVEEEFCPVLCIDEFEGFFERKDEFDIHFLESLRAMSQRGLVLVLSSRNYLGKVLEKVIDRDSQTSVFFNVFQSIKLEPFKVKEAEDFAKRKSGEAKFTEQEYGKLLEYGEVFPLRLQLVGRMIEDAKKAAEEDPECYRPHDPDYWTDFKKSVNEKYQMAVQV